MLERKDEQLFPLERADFLAQLPAGMCCYRVMEGKELWDMLFFHNANEMFYQNLGITWEEFATKAYRIVDFVNPADCELLEKNMKSAICNPSLTFTGHYEVKHKNGKSSHIQWNFRYLDFGEKGHYLLCTCNSVEEMVENQTNLLKELDKAKQEGKKLNNLIHEMPVGMAVIKGGKDWTIEVANHEFFRPAGELIQQSIEKKTPLIELVCDADEDVLQKAMEECRRAKQSGEFEIRIRTQKGGYYWVMCKCQLYYYKDATPYYIMTDWDINDRKALEDELRLLNERYKMLEEVADELPFDFDVENRRFRIPQKYFEIGKIKDDGQEYLAYKDAVQDIQEEDRHNFERMIQFASGKEVTGFVDYRLNMAPEGEKPSYVWHRTYYHSISGGTGVIIRIIGRTYDITNDQKIKERMSEELKKEPLTHLLNKVATKNEVEEFLKTNPAGTHVMFLIDIDDFKKINDTFGHTFGDTVISDVASKIRAHFSAVDLVGRVGGDEFLVFMKDTTIQEANEKAESLCRIVHKRYSGDGVERIITLSVGLSVYGVDGTSFAALFEKADRAMYRTKRSGKNNYAFAVLGDENAFGKERIETEDEYERRLETDKEFLHFAFSLLTHARDLDGSLNVLLEHIAKRFRLDLVTVYEYAENDSSMVLTNYWGLEDESYRKKNYNRTVGAFEQAAVGEITVVTANDTNIRSAKAKGLRKERSMPDEAMRSITGCKFEFSGKRIGCVHFGTKMEKQDWTPVEISTLQELTRVISVFVTLRNKIKEDQKEIKHLQNRDKLTGLYNMEAFRRKVRQELLESNPKKSYALIMCDINNFSYANENFGQEVGDSILYEFGQIVSKNDGVVISCRMYSDYFAVLMEGDSTDEIISDIYAANKKFEDYQNECYPASGMSVATGIYFIRNILVDLETAIENANLARKQSKEKNKKNGLVYEPVMRQNRDEELQVSSQFYDALEDHEFEMFLQPKFDLKKNKVSGAEALARWRKPDGSLVPPIRFIPTLEKFGYITDLDFYIYEQLLIYMKKWKDSGRELFTISTNFSGKHFCGDCSKFVERVTSMIRKYDIEPKYVELEVTESILVDNVESLKVCLKELKDIGFRVAIDDFGTGYSSLSVLLEIPADVVKIDKSFIDRADLESQRDFVVHMGHFIKYAKEEIIFEGIENQQQLEFLTKCDFTYGQGYLFDRPLTVREFEQKYIYA